MAPNETHDLWGWLDSQAQLLDRPTPLTLHSRSGDREDWGSAGRELMRGLPFSHRFLAFLEGHLPPAALTDALRQLRSEAGSRLERLGVEILSSYLRGERDATILRRRLKLTEADYRSAAYGALRALRQAIESPDQRNALEHTNVLLLDKQRILRQAMPSPAAA